MKEIKGTLEHITYQNTENGFTVAKLKLEENKSLVVVVGIMMGVQIGEMLICHGEWKEDKRFGKQFSLQSFEVEIPATVNGIKRYLGSGLVSGIGPALAERIVEAFGEDSLEVIEKEPEKLRSVQGIGKHKLKRIIQSWKEQKDIRGLMLFLQNYSISPTYAQKIYKVHEGNSVNKIKENPYRLADEVVGIGFKKADEIGRLMGIEMHSIMRIESGIEYVLLQLSQQGHTCFPIEKFLDEAAMLLSVGQEMIHDRLAELVVQKRIMIETQLSGNNAQTLIWSRQYYYWEKDIVEEVKRLMDAPILPTLKTEEENLTKQITQVCQKLKIELAEQQYSAVQQSLKQKMHIITGGPGTGKSTITNVILKVYQQKTEKILLAAPTGRAAKRLGEITQHEANTLHSLLSYEFSIMNFRKNKYDPLDCDLLIVDEASMIDTFVMQGLLKAIPNHAQVIFVGDIDQLPSVGAGNVLRDLINSGSIPITRLTQIFRQATHSKIVMNAHRINQGIYPDVRIDKDADFFFLAQEETEQLRATMLSLLSGRLKKAYALDPMKDTQVLTPMNKGELGTQALNEAIQQILNPASTFKNEYKRGLVTFREGDKVMQTRNNYDKNVFNGDIAFIKTIDPQSKIVKISFEHDEIEYSFAELIEIELAYAVTVHKYQGSECKCVLMPIHQTHYRMLYRNLIYTGLTRGKQLVIFLGTEKAINTAIRNDKAQDRYTGLGDFLKHEHSAAFPPIKIIPMLGTEAYRTWIMAQEGMKS
ncbi:MAG: ATP-dependent RecD-like DNA helicase [Saprospiraceae bacterium]|nr:ATP-dependent RecD-like DNA helicase [Saprospiraceae bacterium]